MSLSGRAPSAGSSARMPPCAGYSQDRKSTRLNSSHSQISYAVFCLKKKKTAIGTVESEKFKRPDASHHTIINMSDAGVDAAPIRNLLLTFFCTQKHALLCAPYIDVP